MRQPGTISVEDVDVDAPGPGEVLVRLVATGICQTDRTALKGALPLPLPIVLGHEGAGVVEDVGEGVTSVGRGDHVVLSIVVSCGTCFQCSRGRLALCDWGSAMAMAGLMPDGTSRLHRGDEQVHHFFCQSSFAEYSVVPARSVVPVRKDAPLGAVALLGCGASTGYGAVIRRAEVPVGSSVVVIGCGGVGLAAVMAARAAGATAVIGVDPSESARTLALELGATHVLDPARDRVLRAVNEVTERGADFAFDAVGVAGSLEQAFQSVHPGGEVVAIGLADPSSEVTVDIYSLMLEKRLTGTYAGSIVPHRDIPAAIDLLMAGRLPLDRLVTATTTLAELPDVLGRPAVPGRTVVTFE
jgi:Zn-dependent alcohol dehydrogenase